MIFGAASGGLRPSTPAKVAHRVGAALQPRIAAAGTDPQPADLRPLVKNVKDQRQSDTCAEHSFSVALWVAFAFVGRPLPFDPSPLNLASCTYADVRADVTPPGATLPELTDQGCELQDCANAAAKWGAGPMGPVVGNSNSDVPNGPFLPTGTTPFPEPVIGNLQVAGKTLIGGEYSIDMSGTPEVLVAASLAAGIPVWTGGLVGPVFMGLGANDVAQPEPAGPGTGGHAMVILASRENAAGEWEFFVQSSWGPGFGDNGGVWCSTAWLRAQWECWPMAVAAGSPTTTTTTQEAA